MLETLAIQPSDNVLVLWGYNNSPDSLKDVVDKLKGKSNTVQVEHEERLLMSSHIASSFDVALCGAISPASNTNSQDNLAELARIVKPGGRIFIREPTVNTEGSGNLRTPAKLQSDLKLAGFVDVSQPEQVQLSENEASQLKSSLKTAAEVTISHISAKKPDYEIGASSQLKLSFANKAESKPNSSAAQVWSLSANDMGDDDIELIDDDELLDEDDLKKPDPDSLRVSCADGPKKKKACKNCSCGLAEELEGEKTAQQKPQEKTSACGNCYLGDAFRCSSCPYLGMPAYKPGEKIVLTDRQLNADK